ncbi:MAG: hypothetical protein AAF358_13555 [Pseudomonadota bacterium]
MTVDELNAMSPEARKEAFQFRREWVLSQLAKAIRRRHLRMWAQAKREREKGAILEYSDRNYRVDQNGSLRRVVVTQS